MSRVSHQRSSLRLPPNPRDAKPEAPLSAKKSASRRSWRTASEQKRQRGKKRPGNNKRSKKQLNSRQRKKKLHKSKSERPPRRALRESLSCKSNHPRNPNPQPKPMPVPVPAPSLESRLRLRPSRRSRSKTSVVPSSRRVSRCRNPSLSRYLFVLAVLFLGRSPWHRARMFKSLLHPLHQPQLLPRSRQRRRRH